MNIVEAPQPVTIEKVRKLEEILRQFPKEDQITEEQSTWHHFCKGLYCREYFLPAGGVAVGKQHAEESFFLLVAGTAQFTVADGSVQTVTAPYLAVTQPGGKRAVHAITDSLFLTFHPDPEGLRDPKELEKRIIIPEALPAPEKELLE